MRGKGSISHSFQLFFGITPAYAGKRHTRWSRKSSGRDHPRLCGEKLAGIYQAAANLGSPPPMRGKESIEIRDRDIKRITPAYAGKRPWIAKKEWLYEDHPRLCGEKIRPQFNHFPNAGSPPPMRGKGKVCCLKNSCNGITPAYAGKSAVNESETTETEDHPRLCGEKCFYRRNELRKAGSPPPMRGKD